MKVQKLVLDSLPSGFDTHPNQLEIQNWICNLGNLSQTRALCMTASQKMNCFPLLDKLCDYTMQNFMVGSSNGDNET